MFRESKECLVIETEGEFFFYTKAQEPLIECIRYCISSETLLGWGLRAPVECGGEPLRAVLRFRDAGMA